MLAKRSWHTSTGIAGVAARYRTWSARTQTATTQRLLAKAQVDKLGRKVAEDLGIEGGLSGIGKRDWFPITRQIYAKVNAAGQSNRADTFNRDYGLMRGVTASFFTLAVVVVAADYQNWKVALIVVVLGVVALARMHRFGKHYAREVFVQYLAL